MQSPLLLLLFLILSIARAVCIDGVYHARESLLVDDTLQTYTMGTAIENMASLQGKGSGKQQMADGIIPRLITCLFGYEKAASEVFDVELKVRFSIKLGEEGDSI